MIYLAAPYSTGLPEGMEPAEAMRQRADLINKAAAQLMEEGHIVYSPISHGVSLEAHVSADNLKSHDFWMNHCFGMLDRARQLCVLRIPGWEASRGVQMEINRARRNGLLVTYMEA
ncbi:DUF1937 family protein [Uliginosibacterium sp. 31-12]|uniref:DUF1937 family protein n=1 Tax=Uliginosibacterium sp. 31-12 TaxID=3062781 RepID=UPI0026E20186|nr:DUF1937 family protein [Uliginosibacterium sp. 31-12]MDO6385623.1 DUF1937 family protein [Uliginosibacterium sp. 31-12]